MIIYKNDYGWSAYLTNEYNGKKIKCYMPVAFKKGAEPKGDKENIKPTEWFMSCYESKNGVIPKMVISEYVIVKANESEAKEEKPKKDINIDDEELPFY